MGHSWDTHGTLPVAARGVIAVVTISLANPGPGGCGRTGVDGESAKISEAVRRLLRSFRGTPYVRMNNSNSNGVESHGPANEVASIPAHLLDSTPSELKTDPLGRLPRVVRRLAALGWLIQSLWDGPWQHALRVLS